MANRSLNFDNLKPGGKYLINGRANVYDVVNVIEDIAKQSAQTQYVQDIAKELQAKPGDLYKNIFDFAYKNIVYTPDPEDEQNLRTIYNMFRERKGNCTSYTTLISSVLLALGIPHYLRVTGYNGPREFQHIYVVTQNNGIVMDCVIGQVQDGTDTEFNRDGGHFDKEIPFTTKKDFPMRLAVLNGTKIKGLHSCANGGPCKCGGTCQSSTLGRLRGGRIGTYISASSKPTAADICGAYPVPGNTTQAVYDAWYRCYNNVYPQKLSEWQAKYDASQLEIQKDKDALELAKQKTKEAEAKKDPNYASQEKTKWIVGGLVLSIGGFIAYKYFNKKK